MHATLRYITGRWVLLIAAALPVGCERPPVEESAKDVFCAREPEHPEDLVGCMRHWHAKGAYVPLRERIDPSARDGVIDLLTVMDELLAVNRALRHVARDLGLDPHSLDLSSLADSLDLFSRELRVIRVDEQGPNRARVLAEVSGAGPLVGLDFERRDGRWIYLPGTTRGEVVVGLRHVAHGVNRMIEVANRGNITADQLQQEYRVRVGLPLQRLRELSIRAAASVPPSAP